MSWISLKTFQFGGHLGFHLNLATLERALESSLGLEENYNRSAEYYCLTFRPWAHKSPPLRQTVLLTNFSVASFLDLALP